MALARSDVALVTHWLANGVPADRGTRDFICDVLLPRLWADRQTWVDVATEAVDRLCQEAPHAGPGGSTALAARSGVQDGLADRGAQRPAVPNSSGVQAVRHPENDTARATPSTERPGEPTPGV